MCWSINKHSHRKRESINTKLEDSPSSHRHLLSFSVFLGANGGKVGWGWLRQLSRIQTKENDWKSKDQALPIGSRECFTWVILKTILCLVSDFQGKWLEWHYQSHKKVQEQSIYRSMSPGPLEQFSYMIIPFCSTLLAMYLVQYSYWILHPLPNM